MVTVDVLTQVVLGGLVLGGIYALTAMGLNLLFGIMRILNVAHGEFLMLGAYATFWFFKLFSINPLSSLPIVFGLLFACGVIVHKVLVSRMIRISRTIHALQGSSLLVFFGVIMIVQNLALLAWSPDLKGVTYLQVPIVIFGASVYLSRLLALGLALAIALVVHLFLVLTRTGTAIRAIIQNRDAAMLMGINIGRLSMFASGLGIALGGVSGSLVSLVYPLSPFMGMGFTIKAMTVIVLGGLGSMTGAFLGGLALALVESLGSIFIAPGLKDAIGYVLLIVILLVRPRGLFGRGPA